MRTSPRERAAGSAALGLTLVLLAGVAHAQGEPLTVYGRAVAAAKGAAATEARHAATVNAAAGVSGPAAKATPTASRPNPKAAHAAPATTHAAPAVAHATVTTSASTAPPANLIGPPTPAGLAALHAIAQAPAHPAPVNGAHGVPARLASAKPTLSPVAPNAPSVPSTLGSPMVHLDDHATYVYNALGRRDPFQPLVGGPQYVDVEAPPDLGGIKVVGIVWGTEDQFALCEDGRGNSLVLRKGDKVMNGVVEGLKRDAVVVNLTVDGQSQTVTIPLTRKGEANASH